MKATKKEYGKTLEKIGGDLADMGKSLGWFGKGRAEDSDGDRPMTEGEQDAIITIQLHYSGLAETLQQIGVNL